MKSCVELNRPLLKLVFLFFVDIYKSSRKGNAKFNFLGIIWESKRSRGIHFSGFQRVKIQNVATIVLPRCIKGSSKPLWAIRRLDRLEISYFAYRLEYYCWLKYNNKKKYSLLFIFILFAFVGGFCCFCICAVEFRVKLTIVEL